MYLLWQAWGCHCTGLLWRLLALPLSHWGWKPPWCSFDRQSWGIHPPGPCSGSWPHRCRTRRRWPRPWPTHFWPKYLCNQANAPQKYASLHPIYTLGQIIKIAFCASALARALCMRAFFQLHPTIQGIFIFLNLSRIKQQCGAPGRKILGTLDTNLCVRSLLFFS